MLAYPLLFVFPFAVAYAAASDLLTMTIPNRLNLLIGASFFIVAPVAGLSLQDMAMHLAAGGLVLVAGISLFAFGWLGGGDAKLLAVSALWLGFEVLLPFLLYVTVFGGVLAMAMLAYRRFPAAALPLPDWAARLHGQGGPIPYGIAITAGALAVYPETPWVAALAS